MGRFIYFLSSFFFNCGTFGGMPIDDVPIPRPRAPREGIGLGESPVQDDISLPKVIKKFIKK